MKQEDHWEGGGLSNVPLIFVLFFEIHNFNQKISHWADSLVYTF